MVVETKMKYENMAVAGAILVVGVTLICLSIPSPPPRPNLHFFKIPDGSVVVENEDVNPIDIMTVAGNGRDECALEFGGMTLGPGERLHLTFDKKCQDIKTVDIKTPAEDPLYRFGHLYTYQVPWNVWPTWVRDGFHT